MEPIASRQEAQRRADRIRAFRAELRQLVHEGALELSDAQRQRLDGHLDATLRDLTTRFDVDNTDRDKQMSWGMRIASTCGGLALAAAVMLFFYRFWGFIPIPAQVLLLMAAPLAGLAGAEYASRRETGLYFTSLISLVAVAAFVLDLSVLGSVFNLTPTPHALLAWALFAAAIAYRFGLRLVLAAGLLGGCAWLAAVATSLSGAWWTECLQRPETVVGAGVLVAMCPRRASFAATHRLVGVSAAYLGMLLLSFTGDSFLLWDRGTNERFYQMVGMAVALGMLWPALRRGWNETVNLSAGAFVVFLYLRLVEWWWDWMPRYVFFFTVGLIAILLLLMFRGLRARGRAAA